MIDFERFDLWQWQEDGLIKQVVVRVKKDLVRGARVAAAGIAVSGLLAVSQGSTAVAQSSTVPTVAAVHVVSLPFNHPRPAEQQLEADEASHAYWQALMVKMRGWRPIAETGDASPDPQD